jgi:hypothetical protein
VPRKVFVAGEILTAADVNANLMDQAVMVFDDAAARTTAIPSPIEGMVTYLKSTDKLEKYTTDWVDAAPQKILQVVSTTKTDTFSASLAQGAETEVTGLTATITPSSTSSKVLVSVFTSQGSLLTGNNPIVYFSIFRGATRIGAGGADGSRQTVTTGAAVSDAGSMNSLSGEVLDSPNDTSAITYSVKISHGLVGTDSVLLNRSRNDGNATNIARGVSTITVMEVAG